MKKFILALALLGLAGATHAMADNHKKKGDDYTCEHKGGKKGKPDFSKMDKDSNGTLSLEEFIAAKTVRLEQKFKRIDTDESGSITEEELQKAREKKHKKWDKHKKK